MIDPQTIEKIKDTADIVDVVGDYVNLVRRGANYMGLCPFHNERTPSFSVNKRKNFCFCFSCKQGGSPINFIMKKEGLSYHDALLHLARKYGIEVKERELTDEERARQSEREAMLVANEWAMQKMKKDLLENTEGRDIGLSYLYHRGVTKEAIEAFNLGYALDKGNELVNAATSAGYDIEILRKLGLVGVAQKGNSYDRFRGRVIFPIMNSAGKVIAFGGRDLKGGPAKYINSPESDLYKKSNELYGIFQARSSIIKEDKCFLAEGYLDVIGMWQSGMKNVVASSGTALTDGQIALIHRFTENITLIYDGDAAGIKASLRGIDMLLNHKMKVKVLLLPDGEDPDSFARKHSPEQFRQYVDQNETDIIRFKANVLLKDLKGDPQQRIDAVNDMVSSLAHIPDQVARDIYIQECSRIMNIPEETILRSVIKKRAELVGKWKSERVKKEFPTSKPSESLISSPLKAPSGAEIPASTLPDTSTGRTESTNKMEGTVSPALVPLEKKVLEYGLKYGYLPFCYSNEETPDENVMLNVLEFISEELEGDELSLNVPIYRKIFSLLIEMKDEFDKAYLRKQEETDLFIEKKRKEGILGIAGKDLDLIAIEREEKILEDNLELQRENILSEFAKLYPSRKLASHEDDTIREIVNDLILEKHQLSNIYFRDNNVVETEQDRLAVLVPRAINELKNEIINIQLRDLYNQLVKAGENGDSDEELTLLKKINSKSQIRARMAKDLGERIISPVLPRRR